MYDRPRPDTAQGVFETLLVIDGRPVELDAHLARLRASLAALFPNHTPPSIDVPVDLHSLPLCGGMGAHKWADRTLLDGAQADLPADALPLIVDGDAALEASRANVFAVLEGTLATPPLDGRILPGITRAHVLELAGAVGIETHESELRREDLLTADGAFLTGSVRGIEPISSLDGTPLGDAGALVRRLAGELRCAWLGAPVG